jgi:succinate-semialdehyde dehydrogenase/glutarate-semialdehyde dehydrogenase
MNAAGPLEMTETGSLIDGHWLKSDNAFAVHDKYSGEPIAEVFEATPEQAAHAVRIAKQAVDGGAPPPHARADMLRRAADLIETNRDKFESLLAGEAGFTLADAASEVDRAKITLEISAAETTRLIGDVVPFAVSPGAHDRIGFTQRFPIGVVVAITPFNSPLNTVLHKIGPAYGAGNSVILKPSALTPLTSALLAQILLKAGMPPAFLSVLQGEGNTVGTYLLEAQEVAFYTFTGSTRVGRIIQQAAGLRRTQMELGSIASTIICADADLSIAIPKVANAAFRKAGQVCTSVQRLYVDRRVFDEVQFGLVDLAAKLPAGDPRNPATRIGPLITEQAALRAQSKIHEAICEGGILHCGGSRERSVVTPTVLSNVAEEALLWREEAFAPVLAIRPFGTFEDAMIGANSTPFGLSAGIFTQDIDRALQAIKTMRFGTVQINETSSARSDVMPFGGVKDSGFGKEGPHYAMREMTEERLVIFNSKAARNTGQL